MIDPRTGWPAGDLLSLTVIAPTATEADAMATGMFVLGREKAWEIASTSKAWGLDKLGFIAVSAGKRDGEVAIETWNVDGIWQENG